MMDSMTFIEESEMELLDEGKYHQFHTCNKKT